MATYKKDIAHIATEDEARAAINNSRNPRDKFLIALLYLTGARPCELAHRFKRANIEIPPSDTHIKILVYTAKLQRMKGYHVPYRTLEVARSSPFVENVIIPYAQNFDDDAEKKLVDVSPTRIRQIVYTATKNTLCPYHFRHSRIYKISQTGATQDQLQNWKGAADIRSISPYTFGKPIGRNIKVE